MSKQQVLDADTKAIQEINFIGNVARQGDANTRTFFIIEEAKERILCSSQGNVQLLWIYFTLI